MAKKNLVTPEFKPGTIYAATHEPTGDRLVIHGVNVTTDKVCTAGDPPTIAKLSHCIDFEEIRPLTEKELNYRTWMYGTDWM